MSQSDDRMTGGASDYCVVGAIILLLLVSLFDCHSHLYTMPELSQRFTWKCHGKALYHKQAPYWPES